MISSPEQISAGPETAPSWKGAKGETWANTWTATIYIGRKVLATGRLIPEYTVEEALQKFVDRGLCVSLTPTRFIYKGGAEPGFAVGLIQYPRFPKPVSEIQDTAIELAEMLRKLCQQERCSIVMPDYTVMLSDPNSETESH